MGTYDIVCNCSVFVQNWFDSSSTICEIICNCQNNISVCITFTFICLYMCHCHTPWCDMVSPPVLENMNISSVGAWKILKVWKFRVTTLDINDNYTGSRWNFILTTGHIKLELWNIQFPGRFGSLRKVQTG